MREVAPSIFAGHADDECSERYAFIPTIKVIEGLREQGFSPFFVAQTNCRTNDKMPFARHMVRLRHHTTISAKEANELILLNSHDRTSGFQLLGGVFRDACQNAMVWGHESADFRIRHTGDSVVGHVIEGAFSILENFEKMDSSKDTMKAIELTNDEQMSFARCALTLRYDEGESPIPASQLLRLRRWEDRSNDLWTVFNRIQEALTKGGCAGVTKNSRRMTTRGVTSITENVRLNKALWALAEAMTVLKS